MSQEILNDIKLPLKKPTSVKIATAIAILKVILLAGIIILYAATENIDAYDEGFLSGAKTALIERYDLDPLNHGYSMGYLIGTLALPIVLSIAVILSIHYRKFVPTIAILALDLLLGLGKGIPVLSIILILIVLSTSAREYLKKDENDTIKL